MLRRDIPKFLLASVTGSALLPRQASAEAEVAAGVTQPKCQYWPMDLRRYGAITNGPDCTLALMQAAAVSAQGGGNVTIEDGTYVIGSDAAVPPGATLEFRQGGMLAVAAGRTLTINSNLLAPITRIFAGPGRVVFGNQSRAPFDVFAEWWGATNDGSAIDSGPAINQALSACPNGGRVQLLPGTYVVATTLTIDKAQELCGKNKRSTALLWTGGTGNLLSLGAAADNVYLHDFALDNTGSAANGILVNTSQRILIERIFSNARRAFANAVVQTTTAATVYRLTLRGCDFHVSRSYEETPRCVAIARGHTAVIDDCMFSGFRVAVRVGDGANTVVGCSITNSRFEAFAGIDPGYPGAADAVGIHVVNAQGLLVAGCNFEMAGDQRAASAGQRALVLSTVDGGEICGSYFCGNGVCEAAIQVGSSAVRGVDIRGNVFNRMNGYGVEALVAGAQVEIGINDASAPTTGVVNRALAPNDPTPSIGIGSFFRTSNTSATTISDLDDGTEGKQVFILFDDDVTTIDFTGTHLTGNAGVDWRPKRGDHMTCHKGAGDNWYCHIARSASTGAMSRPAPVPPVPPSRPPRPDWRRRILRAPWLVTP